MSAHPSHAWTASWKPNSDLLVSHCGKCACLLSSIEAHRICPCAVQAGNMTENGDHSMGHPLASKIDNFPSLHTNKLKKLLSGNEDEDGEDGDGDNNYKSKRRVMCTNFEQKGSCQFGSRCKFLHGDKDNRFDRSKRHSSDKFCTHFQKGECRLGDQCKFIHQSEGFTTKRSSNFYSSTTSTSRSQRLCTEYQLNKCEYGDKCKFRHT